MRPLLRDRCYRLACDCGPSSFTADDGSKVTGTRNLIDNRIERHFVGERHRSGVRRIHIVPGTDAMASEMSLHGAQRGRNTGSEGDFGKRFPELRGRSWLTPAMALSWLKTVSAPAHVLRGPSPLRTHRPYRPRPRQHNPNSVPRSQRTEGQCCSSVHGHKSHIS